METAPRNCRFLSLVVVELVLSVVYYLLLCVHTRVSQSVQGPSFWRMAIIPETRVGNPLFMLPFRAALAHGPQAPVSINGDQQM